MHKEERDYRETGRGTASTIEQGISAPGKIGPAGFGDVTAGSEPLAEPSLGTAEIRVEAVPAPTRAVLEARLPKQATLEERLKLNDGSRSMRR